MNISPIAFAGLAAAALLANAPSAAAEGDEIVLPDDCVAFDINDLEYGHQIVGNVVTYHTTWKNPLPPCEAMTLIAHVHDVGAGKDVMPNAFINHEMWTNPNVQYTVDRTLPCNYRTALYLEKNGYESKIIEVEADTCIDDKAPPPPPPTNPDDKAPPPDQPEGDQPQGNGSGGELPVTGARTQGLSATIAAALLAVGAALSLSTRRRRGVSGGAS